jgi:hypothetical protein
MIRGNLHGGDELKPCLVLILVGPPQSRGVRTSGTDQLHLGFLVQIRKRVQAVE